MNADYETKIVLRGTSDEKQRFMEVLKHYVGDERDRETSFGMWGSLDDIQVTDGEDVEIELNGPYGSYGELVDCKLFQEMADACPKGSFSAGIEGEGTYDVQSLNCELKDGLLNIDTTYFSYEIFEAMEEMDEDFDPDEMDRDEFIDEYTEAKHYTYDPVKRKYLGQKPVEKGLIEVNDILKKVLASQGKPHSDEDLADLSVEEAYDLMAVYESGDFDEDDEE
nr:hypothetical protein [Clostridia bacterium]